MPFQARANLKNMTKAYHYLKKRIFLITADLALFNFEDTNSFQIYLSFKESQS